MHSNKQLSCRINLLNLVNTSMLIEYCFFVGYIGLVAGQTLGYSSSDTGYVVWTAFAASLLVVGILFNRFSVQNIIVCGLLIFLSLITVFTTRKFTLLLSILLWISARQIRLRKILTCTLITRCVSMLVLFTFAALGIFESQVNLHYSSAFETFVERFSINGISTNILHLSLFTVFILLVYLYPVFRSTQSIIAMFVLNIAFYILVTHSTTGLLVTSVSLIILWIILSVNLAKRLFNRYACYVVPIAAVFFLYTGYIYGKNTWVSSLDRLMTGRIAYNHYWLTTYGVNLFGHDTRAADAAFDNSVVYVLVAYGLVVFLILFSAFFLGMHHAGKKNDTLSTYILFVFFIYSMSESFLPSAVVNVSLFILLKATSKKLTDCY